MGNALDHDFSLRTAIFLSTFIVMNLATCLSIVRHVALGANLAFPFDAGTAESSKLPTTLSNYKFKMNRLIEPVWCYCFARGHFRNSSWPGTLL